MFIRKRKSIRGDSYQILESYRVGNKVKQRVVVSLGSWPSLSEAIEEAEKKVSWYEIEPRRIERLNKPSLPQRYTYVYWKKRLLKLCSVKNLCTARQT